MPSLGTVDTIRPINAAPPNLRDAMCGPHRKQPATEDEDGVLALRFALCGVPLEPWPEGQGRRPAEALGRRGRASRRLHRTLSKIGHADRRDRSEAEG